MTTYLYIDDEIDGAESFADALEETNSELVIKIHKPHSLEQLIQLLADPPDGLLLDVKLSNTTGEDDKPIPFDGIGLAQQLRSLQTRGQIKPLPIVRLSQPQVIKEFVGRDSTSDDCFDELVSKDDVLGDRSDINRRLLSLAADYPRVERYLTGTLGFESLAELLGVDLSFLDRFDSRLLSEFQSMDGAPAHVMANLFLKKLLFRTGPLISEPLLAVRLGVEKSQSDWNEVLRLFDSAIYRGPFHQGYPRWWMAMVTDIWEKLPGISIPLARARSQERVEVLRQHLGAQIEAIKETKESPGARFWALSATSATPVDPAFGIPLMPQAGHQPWYDAEYLSLEEALRDARNSKIRPNDKARLQRMIKEREKH